MTQAATGRLSLRERLSRREPGPVWVVGHHGAMGHCPENTMASFQRGVEPGADWIELDVHLTQDGAIGTNHPDASRRLLPSESTR
jgi:glycerophosphoryl diester phosphodiesterase